MSVRVVQVDESQKDEPGVEEAVTTIAGHTIKTYARLERVDDYDGKTVEGVTEIEILVPVEDEDAEEEGVFVYNRVLVDLGKANFAKYIKAITPFVDKGRVAPAPTPAPEPSSAPRKSSRASGKAKGTELTEWSRRAKAWLRSNNYEVKDHGRIPNNLAETYVTHNPSDPKPV
ncbi:hypothetical protein [Streptomyces sp. S1]|uniref:hypothetical protein n=1 Tax=Streptomyces sp. S1 TaxID=718288 RepID=UPI003D733F0F